MVRRKWALHLVAGTLMAILLGFIGDGIAVLVSGSLAPTVTAQVTGAWFSDRYQARFTTADGTTCEVTVIYPRQVVVGQRVTLRTAGWPGACDHVWDSADRWWLDYAGPLVFLSGVVVFVFIAWRRPDTLGRWALRRGGWSRPSR